MTAPTISARRRLGIRRRNWISQAWPFLVVAIGAIVLVYFGGRA